jgi:hypothetical protein
VVSETNRIKVPLPFQEMFGAVRKLTGTLHPKSSRSEKMAADLAAFSLGLVR